MYTVHFLKKCPVEKYFFASEKTRESLGRTMYAVRGAIHKYNGSLPLFIDPATIYINKEIMWPTPHVDEVARYILRSIDPITGDETERWEIIIREQ